MHVEYLLCKLKVVLYQTSMCQNNNNLILERYKFLLALRRCQQPETVLTAAGICKGTIKMPIARKNHFINIIITYSPNLGNRYDPPREKDRKVNIFKIDFHS